MKTPIDLAAVLLAGAVVAIAACGDEKPEIPKAEPSEVDVAPLPPSELETQLPPSVREVVLKPFTGDLDETAWSATSAQERAPADDYMDLAGRRIVVPP